MSTPPCLPIIFTKGDKFCDFLFAFVDPLFLQKRKKTRKSVHRTRMPPPNAIQKKGLYVTVTGIP